MAEINLLIIKIQSNFMKNFSTVKKKKRFEFTIHISDGYQELIETRFHLRTG